MRRQRDGRRVRLAPGTSVVRAGGAVTATRIGVGTLTALWLLAAYALWQTDVPGDQEPYDEQEQWERDRRRRRWRWIILALLAAGVAALVAFALTRPSHVSVPDVIGQDVDAATQILDGKGFDVAIKADGSVYLDRRWVPRESLLRALRDIHDQSLDTHVVVKADRRLEYRSVREVMQLVNRAGFTGAGIETRKREASGS